MVESFSKSEGTYIVSRRKYLQTLIPEAIENLTIGQVYQGNVTGTTPFGVFVEFNECLTGMIHKANITEEYRDKITQIQPGTEIVFYVKEVIKNKIILTQYLRESLWDTIRVGSNIRGVVRDTKSFGVLISLDDETTGLIHSNEVEKIKRKFTPGEEINTKVLAVDKQNRKIFLTVDM
jgi:ribosomal protein S1